jgi:DNA repair exonuclease SbcCD ATPase subunit
MESCVELRTKLNRKISERQAYELSLQVETDKLAEVKGKFDIVGQANGVVKDVSQFVQRTIHGTISDLVTRCLRSIFGDDAYEFLISFEQRRGKVEAEMQFVRNGQYYDPMTQVGGGVLDVASFGLRLSALLLKQSNQCRRVLLMDEPFRFLSVQYRPKIRQLMESLAKELDFQFIQVTHIRELEIGDVVTIE